jgi:hypothetical protein
MRSYKLEEKYRYEEIKKENIGQDKKTDLKTHDLDGSAHDFSSVYA